MSPRTERQFEDMRESRKKQILDVSLELFAREGFHTTSISSIAAAAGMSKGLLYNYFESKEDLIQTIMFNGLDNLLQLMDPNHDGVLTRDELKHFFGEFSTAMKNNIHFWTLYFTLFFQPRVFQLIEKKIMAVLSKYTRMFVAYFAANGYEDPETEARYFGAVLDGIGFHFLIDPEHFPIDKVMEKLIKMYC